MSNLQPLFYNTLKDNYGGWLGDQIVPDFADYARVCFQNFGDRVKFWITINEPEVVADQGYGYAAMAPGLKNQQWTARYNTVRAHAKAYDVYKKEFKDIQQGRCGITLSSV